MIIEPCTQYTLIDDPLRSVNNKIVYPNEKCDTLKEGWYRFKINGKDGELPTGCPLPGVTLPYICNSAAAGWYSGKLTRPIL